MTNKVFVNVLIVVTIVIKAESLIFEVLKASPIKVGIAHPTFDDGLFMVVKKPSTWSYQSIGSGFNFSDRV